MEEVIVETGWVWWISGQSSSWGLLGRPLGRDFNCGMCGDLGGWGADLNYWTDLLGGTRRGERDKKTDLLGAGCNCGRRIAARLVWWRVVRRFWGSSLRRNDSPR